MLKLKKIKVFLVVLIVLFSSNSFSEEAKPQTNATPVKVTNTNVSQFLKKTEYIPVVMISAWKEGTRAVVQWNLNNTSPELNLSNVLLLVYRNTVPISSKSVLSSSELIEKINGLDWIKKVYRITDTPPSEGAMYSLVNSRTGDLMYQTWFGANYKAEAVIEFPLTNRSISCNILVFRTVGTQSNLVKTLKPSDWHYCIYEISDEDFPTKGDYYYAVLSVVGGKTNFIFKKNHSFTYEDKVTITEEDLLRAKKPEVVSIKATYDPKKKHVRLMWKASSDVEADVLIKRSKKLIDSWNAFEKAETLMAGGVGLQDGVFIDKNPILESLNYYAVVPYRGAYTNTNIIVGRNSMANGVMAYVEGKKEKKKFHPKVVSTMRANKYVEFWEKPSLNPYIKLRKTKRVFSSERAYGESRKERGEKEIKAEEFELEKSKKIEEESEQVQEEQGEKQEQKQEEEKNKEQSSISEVNGYQIVEENVENEKGGVGMTNEEEIAERQVEESQIEVENRKQENEEKPKEKVIVEEKKFTNGVKEAENTNQRFTVETNVQAVEKGSPATNEVIVNESVSNRGEIEKLSVKPVETNKSISEYEVDYDLSQLTNANYTEEPVPESYQSLIDKAKYFYSKGRYSKCMKILNRVPCGLYASADMLRAKCYIFLGKPRKAIPVLLILKKRPDYRFEADFWLKESFRRIK